MNSQISKILSKYSIGYNCLSDIENNPDLQKAMYEMFIFHDQEIFETISEIQDRFIINYRNLLVSSLASDNKDIIYKDVKSLDMYIASISSDIKAKNKKELASIMNWYKKNVKSKSNLIVHKAFCK
jgi:hypothetical protein